MKNVLRLLFFAALAFVAFGYYEKNTIGTSGDKWVGIGVLIIALVWMPLFLWHRYKNKKLTDFVLKNNNKKTENTENQ